MYIKIASDAETDRLKHNAREEQKTLDKRTSETIFSHT